MKVQSFLLGKDNELDGRQDRLKFNLPRGLYAVADGVSNSFHPEFLAEALCDTFCDLALDDLTDWNECSYSRLLPEIRNRWQQCVKEYQDSLSSRMARRHEAILQSERKVGLSTFCGIHLDLETNNELKYYVLGDSTLFVSKDDQSFPNEFNTSAKDKNCTHFSNLTDAVSSDGDLHGEWLCGSLSLQDIRFIALMTDGAANWFQKCFEQQTQPSPWHTLWDIETQDKFQELALEMRNRCEMDDDLAIILIDLQDKL
jgi:serine/threonine protein phosphatase PrpC